MYESNYFHLQISEQRSEGIKVTGCPTFLGVKRREEETNHDMYSGERWKVG